VWLSVNFVYFLNFYFQCHFFIYQNFNTNFTTIKAIDAMISELFEFFKNLNRSLSYYKNKIRKKNLISWFRQKFLQIFYFGLWNFIAQIVLKVSQLRFFLEKLGPLLNSPQKIKLFCPSGQLQPKSMVEHQSLSTASISPTFRVCTVHCVQSLPSHSPTEEKDEGLKSFNTFRKVLSV